jgi:hypothetical protein
MCNAKAIRVDRPFSSLCASYTVAPAPRPAKGQAVLDRLFSLNRGSLRVARELRSGVECLTFLGTNRGDVFAPGSIEQI